MLLISAFRSNIIDTWGSSIFRKLPTYFGIINTICEPKVRNSEQSCSGHYVLAPILTSILSVQVVLRVAGIPSLSPVSGGQWCGHGCGLLPGAHRCDAAILGEGVWHVWYARLREAWPGCTGGLDCLLRMSGCAQRRMDV